MQELQVSLQYFQTVVYMIRVGGATVQNLVNIYVSVEKFVETIMKTLEIFFLMQRKMVLM